jgi:hypothetical protein
VLREIAPVLLFFAFWFVLQRFILPRLGIGT